MGVFRLEERALDIESLNLLSALLGRRDSSLFLSISDAEMHTCANNIRFFFKATASALQVDIKVLLSVNNLKM